MYIMILRIQLIDNFCRECSTYFNYSKTSLANKNGKHRGSRQSFAPIRYFYKNKNFQLFSFFFIERS